MLSKIKRNIHWYIIMAACCLTLFSVITAFVLQIMITISKPDEKND